MKEQIKYGILLPNGNLATIETRSNHDDYCCGSMTYKLSNDPNLPSWLVDDPNDVALTLFKDIKWYNSSAKNPCWGELTKLKAAKVITTITEAKDIKPPASISTLQVRDIPHILARKYSKIDNLPEKRYVFVLTAQSIEELQQYKNQEVCFDECLYNKRKIIAVEPVPEDYNSEEEKPQTMLICEA